MSQYDKISRLLGTRLEADARANPKTIGTTPAAGICDIELGRIVADPDQPRKTFDQEELDRLAASLKAEGQLEAIRVRYDAGQDRFVVIYGERRWRAAQLAGLPSLQAIVDDRDLAPDRVMHLQLVENALRQDLSPMESARAYDALMATWNCTQQELASRLNVSPAKVSRTLALLKLPDDQQVQIDAGEAAAMSVVKKARRKPIARCKKPKTVRISTPFGVVVVTPKKGQTVGDVLAAAMEAERGKAAA